jgi:F-type H+-transporting ATPase subunit b
MDAIAALGLKFKPLVVQLVGFIILFWILKKYLFGRVSGMIQARGDEIRKTYEENEKTRAEVKDLREQYERRLNEIQEKADSVIQEASKKATQAGQEILEKARREADLLREKRLAELEQEKKKAIAEIRTEVVRLSVLLTTRLIQKTVDQPTAEKLANDVMREIGGMPS